MTKTMASYAFRTPPRVAHAKPPGPIWFGLGHDRKEKLCTDLKLDWVETFRLLGIDFHNNLEDMENNFKSKVKDIKKLFNCWFYRALSPYGKIALIKSLALSKLSHIALVMPSLSKAA